ncbi:MAG: hypothetical protein CM1200mP29_16300 [Verrucomicrobiota bacterium]|nr:MAG: hypothetical protein CM1200mP29_16300 [Verrucomicrobiota bacterium]
MVRHARVPCAWLQPFEGDTWFYVDHLSYALGQATDLTLVRSYYRVDYGGSNLPGAIAYGLDAERYGIVLGLRTSLARLQFSTCSTVGLTTTNRAQTGRTITMPTCPRHLEHRFN